jgi:HSP20 family protein
MTGHRDFGRLQGEIQELLADLWQIPRVAGLRQGFRPPTDCYRTADPPEVVIVVDIAGVDPAQVRIDVTGRMLLVSGRRRRPHGDTRPSYRQMEIDYGQFERQIPLEDDLDVSRARATYENGLLKIVVPVASARPRQETTVIVVKTRE